MSKRSNQRNIWLLGAVFIVVLVVTLLQGRTLEEQAGVQIANSAEDNRIFPGVAVEQVQEIRLSDQQNHQLVYRRTDSALWEVPNAGEFVNQSAPVGGSISIAVNQDIANGIALAAVTLSYRRIIPVDATTDLTQYGFGVVFPEWYLTTVELLLSDGSTRRMTIGIISPTREQYYVQIDPLPDVYVVDRAGGRLDFLVDYFLRLQESR